MLIVFVDFETVYMNWTKGKDWEWRDYWLAEVYMSCPVEGDFHVVVGLLVLKRLLTICACMMMAEASDDDIGLYWTVGTCRWSDEGL